MEINQASKSLLFLHCRAVHHLGVELIMALLPRLKLKKNTIISITAGNTMMMQIIVLKMLCYVHLDGERKRNGSETVFLLSCLSYKTFL